MNKKHGSFWTIKPGQDTERLFLSYGLPEPIGKYTTPLTTLEREVPDGEQWESTRYFEFMAEDEWLKWKEWTSEQTHD